MKNVLKCVASLTAIAIVCTALLLMCYQLLPKRSTEMDYGALIGESGASFEELDPTALGLDPAYAANILEVRRATDGGKVGALVIKSKGTQQFGSFALYVGLQVAESRVNVLGVALDNASLDKTVWTHSLIDSNYKAFVGQDPTKMTTANLVTAGATLTAQAMIDSVRYAYLAAGKIGGGDVTSAEVKLARQYFTTADGFTVTDATKIHTATAAQNFDVYEVKLGETDEAYLFVDKSAGKHYDYSNGMLTANSAGAYYQDGATVAVWRDSADALLKFAGVSTTGKGTDYVSAELGLLMKKPVAKLWATGFGAITGTEGAEITPTGSDAAKAAAAALIVELNDRITIYMKDWTEPTTPEIELAKTVFASALQAGDRIVSSEIDESATAGTMTVYKVGVKNGTATRYGAIFVSAQPAYFTFDRKKPIKIAVATAETANLILTKTTAGVLDDKFYGIEVKGTYQNSSFFPLKGDQNGIPFGLLKVEGYESVTGNMGSALVSTNATGTGVAAAHTLNGLYHTVMKTYMEGLYAPGGND